VDTRGTFESGLETQTLIGLSLSLSPLSRLVSFPFSGTTEALLRGPEQPNFDVEPQNCARKPIVMLSDTLGKIIVANF
jgi:hypothetical protein